MVNVFNREVLRLLEIFLIFELSIAQTKASGNLSEQPVDTKEIQYHAFQTHDQEHNLPLSNLFAGIQTKYKNENVENGSSGDFSKEKSLHSSDLAELSQSRKSKKSNKRRKRKKKRTNHRELINNDDKILRYEIGPEANVSLSNNQEIFSVDMNADYLKDILTGDWLTNSYDGESRKKDKDGIMMKILPLFILPFLIQSSIFPFVVAKLKLLLIKSIIVGKLAIFLLVISAIKSSQKVATYESVPTYYAAEHPSRRSEGFTGYRVEGRPTARVN